MVEMKVWKLALDERTDTPVVILQEITGTRILPIWIGRAEARAIAIEGNDSCGRRGDLDALGKDFTEQLSRCSPIELIRVTVLPEGWKCLQAAD